MFGRRKRRDRAAANADDAGREVGPDESGSELRGTDVGEVDGPADHGPWDSAEIDLTDDDGRLDLGSVRVPIPAGGQIQVEMDNAGAVRAVHLVTTAGRLTMAAFAAPRSAGLWREVATELAAGLRSDDAQVSIVEGPWGREVLGVAPAGAMRFIGVDGPRWMLRCVAAGPTAATEELADTAREVLRDTVVLRGDEPMPVRTTLPVVLPPVLVQQLQAAQAQAALNQAAGAAAPQPPTS